MSFVYEPLSLDKAEVYLERFARSPQKASDYSFANIWGWAEEYGLEWSFGQEMVWIRQTKPEIALWAPVGPWHDLDWSACPRLETGPATFIRVPYSLAAFWAEKLGDRVDIEESREHWDYLYSIPELIELKGATHHRKKNHLNQFKKQYTFRYWPMTPECVEEALALQLNWLRWNELEDSRALLAENRAIHRILTGWDHLPGLLGGALHVDGNMIAYTVAERLSPDTLVIHFEKGNPAFRGVYQAINQMFLEREGKGMAVVNREQDLGDEGLRAAKLSYHPMGFLKKCAVRIAGA